MILELNKQIEEQKDTINNNQIKNNLLELNIAQLENQQKNIEKSIKDL